MTAGLVHPFAVPSRGTAVQAASVAVLGGSLTDAFEVIPFLPFPIRLAGAGVCGDGQTIGERIGACPNQDGADPHQDGAIA